MWMLNDMHNWLISSRQRHWIIINKSELVYSHHFPLFPFTLLIPDSRYIFSLRCEKRMSCIKWNKRNYIWCSSVYTLLSMFRLSIKKVAKNSTKKIDCWIIIDDNDTELGILWSIAQDVHIARYKLCSPFSLFFVRHSSFGGRTTSRAYRVHSSW